MLEGEFNRRLSKALRSHQALRDCVVIKHCQYYMAGVPDFSISNGARTLWIEVKMHGNCCTKLQMNTLMRFREAAFEIVADKDGKKAWLYYERNSQRRYMAFSELVEELARRIVN